MTRTILRSDEFSCPSCVTKIEKGLVAILGVRVATVHVDTGRIEVEHDAATAPVDVLISAVRQAGYQAPLLAC